MDMKERPEKGEWRDNGREGRCSGLMAGSEIKELRMSEQMEEQRPREVKLFPRITLLLGELGRQLPVIVFLGQAFITTRHSRVTLLRGQREPRMAHHTHCLMLPTSHYSERNWSPAHLQFSPLAATSWFHGPMPLGISR